MAYERDKAEWSRASAIMSQIVNVNRGKNDKPIPPDAFSPYAKDKPTSGSKVKLTPENLHLLKALTRERK